jgi:hypothetical protein
MSVITRRVAPAAALFLLALFILLPGVGVLAPAPDEEQYGWTGVYFGSRLRHLDFSPGADQLSDPGWAGDSYWALTQPMGSRFVYAIAFAITGAQPPARPLLLWTDDSIMRPEQLQIDPNFSMSSRSLLIMRYTAIVCFALGLACIAWRLGWTAVLACALFVVLPATRVVYSLGWAEGPLMLGLGLVVLAWGTRWLPFALGLVASFKLTGLALWPAILLPGACGKNGWPRVWSVAAMLGLWTLLEPVSWFAGGPAYLVPMLWDRVQEYLIQTHAAQRSGAPIFLPSRYLMPLELGLLLLLASRIKRILRRRDVAESLPAACAVKKLRVQIF